MSFSLSSADMSSSGSSIHSCLVIGASKNALATSLIIITFSPPSEPSMPSIVAASETNTLSASKGGVAANNPASTPSLNSFPTNRLRYKGFSLSPLLMSIHRVRIIFHPLLKASRLVTFLQTCFPRQYCISLARAFLTSVGSSASPERSS